MSGNWDTPPATYGPNGPPQYSNKFDPNAKRASQIGPTATIKDIYPRVMNEKPDDIAQAAQGWTDFATLIDTFRTKMHDNYSKVEPTWDSDAGIMFTGYVVGSTSSLSDWHSAATANAAALKALSDTVKTKQDRMKQIWNAFDSAAADAKNEEDKHWYSSWTKLGDDISGHNPFDDVMEKYTNQAKSEVLEPLNKAFADAFISVRPGMKWGGPNNGPSEADLKKAMTTLATAGVGSPGVPGAPGAASPAAPAAPPAPPPPAPPAPPTPNKPSMPAAPPPLPALQTAPTVPTAPTMPNAPTAPNAPQAPTAPTLPVAPNALTKPDMPTAPNMPSAPSAPTAPNDALLAMPPLSPNALRSPGGLPSTPNAPDTPSLSGLGRGAPSSGMGEPESMSGMPGRPTPPGMPKSLQGRGGGTPDEPEMPPGMRSGMRPPPQLRGRDDGTKRKPGRSDGGPNDEEPEMPPGMRSGLSGRNGKQNGRTGRNGPGGPGGDGDDIPPNRLGSRRNLQGIKDTKPRWRPGSPEAEELPLRRLPTLNGRFAPETTAEESLESAERALRPGLGGRGLSRPEERAPERRRDKRRKETKREAPAVDFVGDSELFTPEQSAPAVIDRPEEAAPVSAEKSALRPQV